MDEQVDALIKKAVEAETAYDALQYAQAALNAANAKQTVFYTSKEGR
jgi:hypothetical protein